MKPAATSPRRLELGLEDSHTGSREYLGAAAVCALLVVAAAFAGLFADAREPIENAFIPVAATVWSLAELLTAFLLGAQFNARGRIAYGILSFAYGLSALLTWPYLAAFPGIFQTPPVPLGDQQTSVYFWLFWHLSFPALVIFARFRDTSAGRVVPPHRVQVATRTLVATTFGVASLVAVAIYAARNVLPRLVIDGHFQPLFKFVLVPAAIALTLVACGVVLHKHRRTALSLWLAVALVSASADLFLNALTHERYSLSWYAGKLISVWSASYVLFMMLRDLVGLYRRLAHMARIDQLTGLPNRRALEEHVQFVFQNARRQRTGVGLLIVDIDFFKHFNDAFGHLAGDDCLRQVGRALAGCAARPLDLIARYGGEEFVAVLPDTPLHGLHVVAERIRSRIERLELFHGERRLGGVTVSIGIGHAPNALEVGHAALFESADRALYGAKAEGRNRVA
jgi:diguanylate cyclase (GGDEF)-like protein